LVGKSYPVVVNSQGGNFTWKVTDPSIANITAFSEVQDANVNATVDFISAALTSVPEYSVATKGIVELVNCVKDDQEITTQCTLNFSLPVTYDDDGTHEAIVTADGKALNNVSLNSENGFSGTLT